MLIDAGLLTEDRLAEALVDARRAGMKLGGYLIRNGIISEPEIVDTISQQLRVPKYKPNDYPIVPELAQVVPGGIAQKYQVAPLEQKGSLLTIAMTDPTDLAALDTIEDMTNSEVVPVIATENDINSLMSALYGQRGRANAG